MKLILYYVVLLLVPIGYLVANNGTVVNPLEAVIASFGIGLLLFAIWNLLSARLAVLAAVIVSVLLLLALCLRIVLVMLYDFSGRGFGSEFFLHLEPTSFRVGWGEYGDAIMILAVVLAVLMLVSFLLCARQRRVSFGAALVLIPLSTAMVYVGSVAAPEALFAQALVRYMQADGDGSVPTFAGRVQALETLKVVRGSTAMPVLKNQIQARLAERPLNLVLVYLESFNTMLTDESRYPGLTPRINALKSRMIHPDPVYASSYLTIEGIANSQCGTLMNMEFANNSLITPAGRLPRLPCLGDILRVAGYHQIYVGGATLDFAGKGQFLREHGYDKAYGWEHWEEQGHVLEGTWGLSDRLLFDEALELIEQEREKPAPFNLTLLTLGTHLPGFTYQTCPQYTDKPEQSFLNAIHCTDFLFGNFVDELERRGILEDTVLFAQADHGVFESPDMVRLFGDAVADTRLLTLVSIPDSMRSLRDAWPEEVVDAGVNTVATLLDLLGIEHNVEFILARSRFDAHGEAPYVLTRRSDYMDGRVIANDPESVVCSEPVEGAITLPLDRCSKRHVLSALSTLNLAYTRQTPGEGGTQVCELAAEIEIAPDSGEVSVKWGNENLSRQFFHRGTRLRSTDGQGVYTLLLDADNGVRNAVFFGADNAYDMWRLYSLLRNQSDGVRVLLVSNIEVSQLSDELQHLWPRELGENHVIHGSILNTRVDVEFASDSRSGRTRFTPKSCDRG